MTVTKRYIDAMNNWFIKEEIFNSGFQVDPAIMSLGLYSYSLWHGWDMRIGAQDVDDQKKEEGTCVDQGLKDRFDVR